MIAAVRTTLALVALLASVVACAGAPSFDPAAGCAADGTGGGAAPGAYPELESLIPAAAEGRGPDQLDSGRSCPKELGSLVRHGLAEVRFAGGIWGTGERSGFTLALMSAPGLRSDWVAEFYHEGARGGGRDTEDVTRSGETLAGARVERIEVLNERSFQTIVVLPERDDVVRIALVASDVDEIGTRAAHDAVVVRAVETWLASG